MKFSVVRHTDKLGRICIPMDFRKSFGISEDTKIIIEETNDGIILKVVNDHIVKSKKET